MNGVATANNNSANTWLFVLEGIALILFGLAAMIWPALTFYTFTVIFGLYALVAGVVNVIGGIVRITRGWQSVARILIGGLLIGAGSYVLNRPGITALTLVIIIGFTFLVRGVIDIVAAVSEEEKHKALSIIAGVLSVLVGLVLLRYPVGGGLAYVWVLGLYALVSGPILIAMGLSSGHQGSREHNI